MYIYIYILYTRNCILYTIYYIYIYICYILYTTTIYYYYIRTMYIQRCSPLKHQLRTARDSSRHPRTPRSSGNLRKPMRATVYTSGKPTLLRTKRERQLAPSPHAQEETDYFHSFRTRWYARFRSPN